MPIQGLNLIPPAPEPPPKRGSSEAFVFDPALKPDPRATQAVQEAAKELAEGPKPEWLFLCALPNGLLSFQSGTESKIVLLFLTIFAALDYLEATKTAAEVRAINFESIPELAMKWQAAGATGLALNRCPRCPLIAAAMLDSVADARSFALFWGVRRATQIHFGQRAVREFLTAKEMPARRSALEHLRDHIDCSVPYVYELLAFFAHLEKDESAHRAALEQLKKFGPPFANWQSKWDDSSSDNWIRALAEANVGLCQSFGIQPKVPERS